MAKKAPRKPTRQCEKCGHHYHPRRKVCDKCDAPNPDFRLKPQAPDLIDTATSFVEAAGGIDAAEELLRKIKRMTS